MSLIRLTVLSLALATGFALVAADVADARVGGGSSSGSRGSKTYTAPPATNTAPSTAAPMERSMTQKGAPTAAQSAQPGAAAAQPSRFGGLRSLLMGGLIGAALASIFGFGALASVLGFLLQIALVAGVAWLVISYFRNRAARPAVATATASPGQARQNIDYRAAAGAVGGGAASALTIGENDFDAFERLLGEVQAAYGKNDLGALGDRATPEMLSYFAEELDANRKKGVRNEVSEPKLLQGDLAESWREAGADYATVAMRFSMVDADVEAATGRVLSGSKTEPREFTEVWTFRRPSSGAAQQWELSAIQQAA